MPFKKLFLARNLTSVMLSEYTTANGYALECVAHCNAYSYAAPIDGDFIAGFVLQVGIIIIKGFSVEVELVTHVAREGKAAIRLLPLHARLEHHARGIELDAFRSGGGAAENIFLRDFGRHDGDAGGAVEAELGQIFCYKRGGFYAKDNTPKSVVQVDLA